MAKSTASNLDIGTDFINVLTIVSIEATEAIEKTVVK